MRGSAAAPLPWSLGILSEDSATGASTGKEKQKKDHKPWRSEREFQLSHRIRALISKLLRKKYWMTEILVLIFSPLLWVHSSRDIRHLSNAASHRLHTTARTLKQLKTAFLKRPFSMRTVAFNNALTCPTGNFETPQPLQQLSNISMWINYVQERSNTTFRSSQTPLSSWLFCFKYKICYLIFIDIAILSL